MQPEAYLHQPQRRTHRLKTKVLRLYRQTLRVRTQKCTPIPIQAEMSNYIQGLPEYIRKQLAECKEKIYRFVDEKF